MWSDVTQFAAAHPWWAAFLGLWAAMIAYGLGCDVARAFRNEPHVVSSPNSRPIWDDDV